MSEYLEPYRRAVRVHGTAFESLLWLNRDYQERRFAALAEEVDLTGRVVADMGCGRGDFAAWLHAREVAYGGFVGVEAIEKLVVFCRERAQREGIPETAWIEADFARDQKVFRRLVKDHGVDTIFFSGSLNTFEQGEAQRVLDGAWNAVSSRRDGVLAFNFLSSMRRGEAIAETGPARRFDTLGMIRWTSERSPVFTVRHDYLGDHDATIVMRTD